MKLYDLLNLIDPDREYDDEFIQIARDSWEEFDEVSTSSRLLIPFYEYEIECLGAIHENTIRVGLKATDTKFVPISELKLKGCIWTGINEALGFDPDYQFMSPEATKIYEKIKAQIEKEIKK